MNNEYNNDLLELYYYNNLSAFYIAFQQDHFVNFFNEFISIVKLTIKYESIINIKKIKDFKKFYHIAKILVQLNLICKENFIIYTSVHKFYNLYHYL